MLLETLKRRCQKRWIKSVWPGQCLAAPSLDLLALEMKGLVKIHAKHGTKAVVSLTQKGWVKSGGQNAASL